jgi:hypothetical protein
MKIFVFGNDDLEMDSLPLRILPRLSEKFPEIEFVTVDPNEEWNVPENLVVIDTAVGIKDVTIFDSLEKFSAPPRVGMHDFDALTNLRYLWKLGKIKKIKIIAVPAEMGEPEATEKIIKILKKNVK